MEEILLIVGVSVVNIVWMALYVNKIRKIPRNIYLKYALSYTTVSSPVAQLVAQGYIYQNVFGFMKVDAFF